MLDKNTNIIIVTHFNGSVIKNTIIYRKQANFKGKNKNLNIREIIIKRTS